MPTYVYKCPRCNAVFEIFRRITEEVEYALCPQCGTKSTQVLTGELTYILKGGCWFKDGYASSEKVTKEYEGEGR